MIHPIILVLAILVILVTGFWLIYLFASLFTRSGAPRPGPEHKEYGTVAEGKFYSIRLRDPAGGLSDSVDLTITDPKTHQAKPATMTSAASVQVEINAEVMDDMATAWLRYRGLLETPKRIGGSESDNPENAPS